MEVKMMTRMIAAYMTMGQQARGDTTAEVLTNAGMDFGVKTEPLYTAQGREVRSKFQRVARTDNDHTLGVVGKTYNPLQNEELLAMADTLVGTGEIEWDRVGMIDGGSRLYASFALPDAYRIDGWDDLNQYIYLTNAHDGSQGVRCVPTNVRLGCTNQFRHAMSSLKRADINPRDLSIRHSSKMHDRLAEMRHAIKLTDTLNQNFADTAGELMCVEMDAVDRAEYYIDVLGLKTDEKLRDGENEHGLKTRGFNTMNHLLALEKSRTNNTSAMRDTAWQSFNVITEYIDHAWVHNAAGTVNQKRVESAVLGVGSNTKAKAWDEVVARIIA